MPLEQREMTTDALVYEALQRHLRNALVDHIRVCLVAQYGSNEAQEKVRQPFTEDSWTAATRSAESARSLGYVTREHRDTIDYLGIDHFFNVFEKYFNDLIPPDELPPKEFAAKLRQETLGWLRDIRGVRDPVSHPASDDFPVTDAVRVVDSAWRLLRRLHLDEAADAVAGIYAEMVRRTAESAPPDPLDAGLDDTLPPAESIVVDFIGRDEELKSLWAWLLSGDSNRWMLAGDGGKGKSATAYRFARHVRAFKPQPLCAVFWMSAKKRRFDEGQTVATSSVDFWNLDSALNKILIDYGWGEQTSLSLSARKATVLTLLEEFPALLVVDDLDSIAPEDEDVVEFLTLEAPRQGTRVLITSRRLFAGMGRTCTTVSGLSEQDSKEFLVSRQLLLDMAPKALNDSQRRQISAICEGSPLYMEDFLRLLKVLPLTDAIDAWQSQSGDDVRRYALERELEMLTREATEVLYACALAQQPLSTIELQRVTGLSTELTIAALNELQRMYLVPAPELIEEVPRLQVNRNLALLVQATLEDSQATRVRSAISTVLGRAPGPAESRSVGDYARQARVLVEAGRFEDAVSTIEAGLERHPSHPRLYGMLGWVYWKHRPSRLADARNAWNRAYELGASERPMYVNWSALEADAERWESAAAAAEKGLERIGDSDARLLTTAGYARSRFGQSLTASFNAERGRQELGRADAYLKRSTQRAIKEGLSDYDVSRAFRAWLINAQAAADQDAICDRLAAWLDWKRDDPAAQRELERQRRNCPQVAG